MFMALQHTKKSKGKLGQLQNAPAVPSAWLGDLVRPALSDGPSRWIWRCDRPKPCCLVALFSMDHWRPVWPSEDRLHSGFQDIPGSHQTWVPLEMFGLWWVMWHIGQAIFPKKIWQKNWKPRISSGVLSERTAERSCQSYSIPRIIFIGRSSSPLSVQPGLVSETTPSPGQWPGFRKIINVGNESWPRNHWLHFRKSSGNHLIL